MNGCGRPSVELTMSQSLVSGRWRALVIAFAVGSTGAVLGDGPLLGQAAPPLDLSKVLQAPVGAGWNWSQFRGEVVVLEFWATWCGPCVASIPHWNKLVNAFRDQPVRFLAITDENEQVVATFLKRKPIHSWVGLENLSASARDSYGVRGIPATVIVNQNGVVSAVTHPARLEPKHIAEVLSTGKSSLPAPSEPSTRASLEKQEQEPVPARAPLLELSVRPSGPRPKGHSFNCWKARGHDDVIGEYASVKSAILSLLDGRELLLDCRTPLPGGEYDFTVRVPGQDPAQREQLVEAMFRSAFGLQVQSVVTPCEVYRLSLASTNAPGLRPNNSQRTGNGRDEAGGFTLKNTPFNQLAERLEQWLRKPVLDGTGLTNRYDIRLRWKMSQRELLTESLDKQVVRLCFEADASQE
jgi:uncharacterized protein (TIGR03435 family)